jgi:single-stranded DNA-binding protein
MQAYANVGTAPTRHTAKTSGKAYWEFRASESARGEDKNPTWYTVRIFQDHDPQLKKGDFVMFTGKLKNDVFMSRDGKPMGVLTVLAFNLQKVAKDGKRETVVDAPQAVEAIAMTTKDSVEIPEKVLPAPVAASASNMARASTSVAAAMETHPQATTRFSAFGQSWGMATQTLRYGI